MQRAFSLYFFLISINLYAQKEFNNWFFGHNAGLDFNQSPPVALTSGALYCSDQTSSISDSIGSLLMYSDGITVWNRNNVQMPNGNNLMGNAVTYGHASIIARKPNSTNLFYIFSIDAVAGGGGIQYSIVDIKLQGGNGDVISKNNMLVQPVCEKLAATKHKNGTDIWIITHLWNSDAFYAYLLTSSGISAPVITHIGPIHQGGSMTNYNSAGQLAASPDGTKLALAIYDMNFYEIYDFNDSTGIVSNRIQISGYNKAWGVQFSPDGSKLYTTQWTFDKVYQFDMLAGSPVNIANSVVVIGTATSPDPNYKVGSMQLGPNAKLYIAKMNSNYLAVINNPNIRGTACNFDDNGIYLAGKLSQAGLPNYIITKYSTPDFTFQNSCAGDTISFQSVNTINADSIKWNFNDLSSGSDNTSILLNTQHVFYTSGVYNVSLITYNSSNAYTVTHSVTVYSIPQVDIGNDTSICNGNQITLDAGDGYSSYLWSTGFSTQTITVYAPTTYSVTVTDSLGCYSIDSINILTISSIDLGSDISLCDNDKVTLNADIAASSYLWSTGETTSSIIIDMPDTYWVDVAYGNCVLSDTVHITGEIVKLYIPKMHLLLIIMV